MTTKSRRRKKSDNGWDPQRASAAWSALFNHVRRNGVPAGMRFDNWSQAHTVAHYLCWWYGMPDGIFPGQDKIASDLRVARYTVGRALAHAEGAGLIERIVTRHRGQWPSTTYRLCFLDGAPPSADYAHGDHVRTTHSDHVRTTHMDQVRTTHISSTPLRGEEEERPLRGRSSSSSASPTPSPPSEATTTT